MEIRNPKAKATEKQYAYAVQLARKVLGKYQFKQADAIHLANISRNSFDKLNREEMSQVIEALLKKMPPDENKGDKATDKQKGFLEQLLSENNKPLPDHLDIPIDDLTKSEASDLIGFLKGDSYYQVFKCTSCGNKYSADRRKNAGLCETCLDAELDD